jgi:hypothetical protein
MRRAKARSAYQDFLALWKDADPDIPILKEGKAEYAKRVLSSALSRRVKALRASALPSAYPLLPSEHIRRQNSLKFKKVVILRPFFQILSDDRTFCLDSDTRLRSGRDPLHFALSPAMAVGVKHHAELFLRPTALLPLWNT